MFLKLFKIAGIFLLMAFIVVTLAFTSGESKDILCRDIEVSFNNSDQIHVSKNDVMRRIKAADNQLLKKTLDKINSDIIEKEVEKLQAIKEAEVYKIIVKDTTSYKGVLVVKVKHRKPVVRIISDNGSYFLDKEGNRIPVSSGYTANVLVVTGSLSEKYATEEMLPFVLYIENNAFWNAQIEQIHVENDGDVLLSPLVGDQIIEMGSLDDYAGKLRKMRAFYDQVLVKNNWNKYKRISLKYNNQVVAKKS